MDNPLERDPLESTPEGRPVEGDVEEQKRASMDAFMKDQMGNKGESPEAREARLAKEEALKKENERLANLFNDVRILADHLIEDYLVLDRKDKIEMADLYGTEKFFKILGGLRRNTKKRLINKLKNKEIKNAKKVIDLTNRISNYSKLLPILENYIKWSKENLDIRSSKSSLTYYLTHYNIKEQKVKAGSPESMNNFYIYDFKNNKKRNKKRI